MVSKKEKKNRKRLERERVNKPKCENCACSNGYPRIKTKEWICRSCGHITSMDKGKK